MTKRKSEGLSVLEICGAVFIALLLTACAVVLGVA